MKHRQVFVFGYNTHLKHMRKHMKEPNSNIRTFFVSREGWQFFLFVFGAVLLMSYAILYAIDIVPEPLPKGSNAESNAVLSTTDISANDNGTEIAVGDATPQRIIIDVIGTDVNIVNPESQNIAVLDEALKRGVVHYPGSGDLEDNSNLFLFAHSSYLPVVQNELYRAFNGLNKLVSGDVIRVQSGGYEYRYSVVSVELVNADEALVELSNRAKKLTLSTCNSFGDPGERFVVEADFLERAAL